MNALVEDDRHQILMLFVAFEYKFEAIFGRIEDKIFS